MITYTQLLEKIHDPAIVDKLKNLLQSGNSDEFFNLYKNTPTDSKEYAKYMKKEKKRDIKFAHKQNKI